MKRQSTTVSPNTLYNFEAQMGRLPITPLVTDCSSGTIGEDFVVPNPSDPIVTPFGAVWVCNKTHGHTLYIPPGP